MHVTQHESQHENEQTYRENYITVTEFTYMIQNLCLRNRLSPLLTHPAHTQHNIHTLFLSNASWGCYIPTINFVYIQRTIFCIAESRYYLRNTQVTFVVLVVGIIVFRLSIICGLRSEEINNLYEFWYWKCSIRLILQRQFALVNVEWKIVR